MNTLSILIYLAGVAGNFATVLGVAAGILTAAFGGIMLFKAIEENEFVFNKKMAFGALGLAFAAALIPSSDTIYLIAASEYGQTVISTPEAQSLMQDAYEVIKGKLAEMKG